MKLSTITIILQGFLVGFLLGKAGYPITSAAYWLGTLVNTTLVCVYAALKEMDE